jgi:ribose transport system substrate-binding protein
MTNRSTWRLFAAGVAALALLSTGCEEKKPAPAPTNTPTTAPKPDSKPSDAPKTDAPKADSPKSSTPASKKSYSIGIVAKSTTNPVFQAAKTGAFDACAALSKEYSVEIKPIWLTPVKEDAQEQAQKIEQLVSQGVDGISISCTDGDVLLKPIDDAVAKGVVVVTFDSDSAKSKRMAYYGINDVACGKAIMQQLAKAMGDKGGTVAILSGSQTAPNLNARIQGVQDELKALESKGFKFKKVFYTKEDPASAVGLLQQTQSANPDISGWAMVGGWPLFTDKALDGIADKAKVVSVDTLPEQLKYVENGQVACLIGQDCYGWGYESVRMIVEKLVKNKTPDKPINNFELDIVTKDNVANVKGRWEKWLGNK